MKKVLFILLVLVISASSWAAERICADSLGVLGGPGFHCPKPSSVPFTYSIDSDSGLISISTTETEQVRVQVIGQFTGLIDDEYFYGYTSIVLYNHDLYEIKFIIHSGKIYNSLFYY